MRAFTDSLWIALGAALGANARYWIGYLARANTQSFPWPTLVINVIGSALLGAFTAIALAKGWGNHSRLFFAVGLCGGFTTFSTFSFEVIQLLESRSIKLAALYALGSLILCVCSCFAAAHVARSMFTAADTPFSRK